MNNKEIIKYIGLGIIFSAAVFFIYGIPTAIIQNPFFKRMITATELDLFLLILTSILFGTYFSLQVYSKRQVKASNVAAYSSGFAGIFVFACPICNVLLVSLFGTSALLMYFEPVRPYLGMLIVIILTIAIYLKVSAIRKGDECKACKSIKKHR